MISTEQTSSDVTFQRRRRVPRTAWRYIPKKGCTWSTVWRVVTHDGVIFSELRREEQKLEYSDRQRHCGLRHASKNLHQGAWRLSVGAIVEVSQPVPPAERLCSELRYSYSWQPGKTSRLSKGKKVIECSIDNVVPVVGVTKQIAVSIEFSSAKGNFKREQEVEDTMLDLFTEGLEVYYASSSTPNAGWPKACCRRKPLDDKLPVVVTDAGGDTEAKDTKSQQGIIGSQTRGNHDVFTQYPKDPNCEDRKKTTTRARSRIQPQKRVDTQFGDLITADHNILNVETSRDADTKNAVTVQDDFTNWIQSYPMETKETSETMSFFTNISSSFTEAGKSLHRLLRRVYQSWSRSSMEL